MWEPISLLTIDGYDDLTAAAAKPVSKDNPEVEPEDTSSSKPVVMEIKLAERSESEPPIKKDTTAKPGLRIRPPRRGRIEYLVPAPRMTKRNDPSSLVTPKEMKKIRAGLRKAMNNS
jgi:hypothetical protein